MNYIAVQVSDQTDRTGNAARDENFESQLGRRFELILMIGARTLVGSEGYLRIQSVQEGMLISSK